MMSPRMTGVRKPDTSCREGRRLVRGILDALSRRIVGYAISRSIDERLAVAASRRACACESTRRHAAVNPAAALPG